MKLLQLVALLVLALVQTQAIYKGNVVFVTEDATGSVDAGWSNLLFNDGWNVTRNFALGGGLSAGKIAELNTFDLIILSNGIATNTNYGSGNAAGWNSLT